MTTVTQSPFTQAKIASLEKSLAARGDEYTALQDALSKPHTPVEAVQYRRQLQEIENKVAEIESELARLYAQAAAPNIAISQAGTPTRLPSDGSFDARALYEALLSAYPDYDDLARMLDFDCGITLRHIVSADRNQQDVIHAVITQARAKGWITKLVLAAADDVPGNAELAEMASTVR